ILLRRVGEALLVKRESVRRVLGERLFILPYRAVVVAFVVQLDALAYGLVLFVCGWLGRELRVGRRLLRRGARAEQCEEDGQEVDSAGRHIFSPFESARRWRATVRTFVSIKRGVKALLVISPNRDEVFGTTARSSAEDGRRRGFIHHRGALEHLLSWKSFGAGLTVPPRPASLSRRAFRRAMMFALSRHSLTE